MRAAEYRRWFEAAAWLIAVRVGLWIASFAWVRRQLEGVATSAPHSRDAIVAVTSAIDSVARRLPAMTCLVRALAADGMLRQHGFQPELRFGVRQRGLGTPAIDAHAWLECDGRIVIGFHDALAEYGVLSRPRS